MARPPPLAGRNSQRPLTPLSALLELLQGGLELGEEEFAVVGDVGDGNFPVFDGVGLVVERGVGASQTVVRPEFLAGMALLIQLRNLEGAFIA